MNYQHLFLASIFWASLFLIVYTYFLYPVVLFLAYAVLQVRRDWHYLNGRRNRRILAVSLDGLPKVSIIIPAYNEEACILAKIANLRNLDYPKDKVEVIFVSDGSTDRTNSILEDWSASDLDIQPIFLPVRMGKSNALNRAVAAARGDILVLTDTSTQIEPNAIHKLIRHFADPKVGVACGSLQFRGTAESRGTEGVYWKYETMLRLMEARLGATLTASGAIYALRRDCYRPISPDTLIDDFVIPMNARKQGHKLIYDPEVIGIEIAASTISGEFTRRVRLAVGSFRALADLIRVPLPGFARVAFISHKLLRWVLPFLLIGVLVTNLFLVRLHAFYVLTLAAQFLFYLWASLGAVLRNRAVTIPGALIGYFVVAMNLAFLVGFFRCFTRRGETTWQRVA
jgi:cellulose synthase/poly-beta-1,6-N-acetylglucosamine synthase-like glycosyltransferase